MKSIGINITLTIYDKKTKKMVRKYRSHKRKRIWFRLQADKNRNHAFKVRVHYKPGFINESIIYNTKKETIQALRAFTEKDLVKEFCND